jgi:hypothetical protein
VLRQPVPGHVAGAGGGGHGRMDGAQDGNGFGERDDKYIYTRLAFDFVCRSYALWTRSRTYLCVALRRPDKKFYLIYFLVEKILMFFS